MSDSHPEMREAMTVFLDAQRFAKIEKLASQADLIADDLANRILLFAIDVFDLPTLFVATVGSSPYAVRRNQGNVIDIVKGRREKL